VPSKAEEGLGEELIEGGESVGGASDDSDDGD
jgi:hypothetical protein